MNFPSHLAQFRATYKFNARNLFTTTNPKVNKGTMPTIVLHLHPMMGGVCPAAGTCAAVCLHRAGNIQYLNSKIASRTRKSKAFMHNRDLFVELLVVEAARFASEGYVGVRLNGTSDVAWEREYVTVRQETSKLIEVKFGRQIEAGVYTVIEAMRVLGLQPYDYTKRIDRDFTTPGYHLTLSWGGVNDKVIFDVAKQYGLNVAAGVYGVKRSKPLPSTMLGYEVVDGDKTDWRVGDPADTVRIVGLRIKRTPGQTEAQARAFCIG